MKKMEGKTPLNMNIRRELLEKIETFRFRRRFNAKSAAIEFLLEYALKANPKREPEEPSDE